MPKLNLDELTAEVERNESVDGSATLLMTKMFALIEENANDPAAVKALVARFRQSTDALAAAVVANTPAADEPATGA